jgi:dephospho-CoA kinase
LLVAGCWLLVAGPLDLLAHLASAARSTFLVSSVRRPAAIVPRVPFPDELAHPVTVTAYDPAWPAEFERLAARLADALGGSFVAVDHVGSTSVPGLPAKDCVDAQVRVPDVDAEVYVPPMAALGFRCRPEPWNRSETSAGVEASKLVFAPPAGARPVNVHFRRDGGPNARYALLFRDYLRADTRAREGWGAFKQRLAVSVPDLLAYGQIKAPATEVLMAGAERWARETGWVPA